MTIADLKNALDDQGIEYPSGARKDELIQIYGGAT
ncbi:HeH/LEM domain-containing protein [Candidatus Enterococcus testudinis]|nr:HeH/LEM domain-containing protein [Enterococcus sp. 8G7_MSG3316]